MFTSTAARVLEYAQEHRDRFVRLTRDLVEAESPSAHPDTHDEVRRILKIALALVLATERKHWLRPCRMLPRHQDPNH